MKTKLLAFLWVFIVGIVIGEIPDHHDNVDIILLFVAMSYAGLYLIEEYTKSK